MGGTDTGADAAAADTGPDAAGAGAGAGAAGTGAAAAAGGIVGGVVAAAAAGGIVGGVGAGSAATGGGGGAATGAVAVTGPSGGITSGGTTCGGGGVLPSTTTSNDEIGDASDEGDASSIGIATGDSNAFSRSGRYMPSSDARNGLPAASAASAARRIHTTASFRSPRAHNALAVDNPQTTSSESSDRGSGSFTECSAITCPLRYAVSSRSWKPWPMRAEMTSTPRTRHGHDDVSTKTEKLVDLCRSSCPWESTNPRKGHPVGLRDLRIAIGTLGLTPHSAVANAEPNAFQDAGRIIGSELDGPASCTKQTPKRFRTASDGSSLQTPLGQTIHRDCPVHPSQRHPRRASTGTQQTCFNANDDASHPLQASPERHAPRLSALDEWDAARHNDGTSPRRLRSKQVHPAFDAQANR